MDTPTTWIASSLFFWVIIQSSFSEGCFKEENDVLLNIKASFSDKEPYAYPDLSYLQTWEPYISWVEGTDCCEWEGVQCNAITGRVAALTLVDQNYLYQPTYLNFSDFLVFQDLKELHIDGIDCCVEHAVDENGICLLGRSQYARTERRKLSNLEVLELNLTSSNACKIEHCFSAISSLKSLRLSVDTSVTLTAKSFKDSWKMVSSKLRNLEHLRLHLPYLPSDIILPSLKKLTSLRTLDLANNGLDNTFNFSDLASKFMNLEVLDLGFNHFNESEEIFSSLSVLSSLKSLTLRGCDLTSISYSSLSLLHSLEFLDLLSPLGYDVNTSFPAISPQGTKVSSSLKTLYFNPKNVDANMLRSLKDFPSLTMLEISGSNFDRNVTAADFVELRKLEHLVLDNCFNLQNDFFKSIGALTSLRILSVNSQINGSLPEADWSNLKELQELDISYSEFEGSLPSSFVNMTSLQKLDFSGGNRFSGNPASNLASLTSLEYLDFTGNQFQIPSSFSFFANHSYLKVIHGNGDNIIPEPHPASQTWVPKFQLQELILPATTRKSIVPFPNFLLSQHELTVGDISGWKLVGEFPNWLLVNNTKLIDLSLGNNFFTGHVQFPSHVTPNIQRIDVSENDISGQIHGNNISSIFPKLYILNMSGNAISGSLPSEFGPMKSLVCLDLSDNDLSGEILANIQPKSSLIRLLKLSNNKFTGEVTPLLALNHLAYLCLDRNLFSGEIPSALFSNTSLLSYVDLSNNNFVGKLPRLAFNSSALNEVSLSNNHLEGNIPTEFGGELSALDLSGNNFSGPVPSFENSVLSVIFLGDNRLSSLPGRMFSENGNDAVILDLSNNEISGTIEDIISNTDVLNILILKGNKLTGNIPEELCKFSNVLSLVDFSHNSLSGPIPKCLGKITFDTPDPDFMLNWPNVMDQVRYPPSIVLRRVNFTTKSRTYNYQGMIFAYMTGLDLSHNKLGGNIPPELGNMTLIRAINLSYNDLTGHIPSTFSNLKQIESLDLSFNKLSGNIPPQLTKLTSLEVFSVAYNNLSGSTPDRNNGQLITFDGSSYEGNPYLCGPPLRNPCADHNGQGQSPLAYAEGDNDNNGFMDMYVFCISMGVSWTTVLLVMVAVFYINPYWRRIWFYFIELVIDTCYYFVIDHFPRLYQ
ncbi:hypothetical protein PIB30_021621 [Stylosanthes scabra]|uniref:Leucine-rich repeat-containing N-terminal plant-type domain-containing protein n=1 Tax=Stylosanthes scabra TaxID=79078 RepID=A0ABU6W9Y9_9FABA|nr:hypothetical protein [Stylosanthes scabra]